MDDLAKRLEVGRNVTGGPVTSPDGKIVAGVQVADTSLGTTIVLNSIPPTVRIPPETRGGKFREMAREEYAKAVAVSHEWLTHQLTSRGLTFDLHLSADVKSGVTFLVPENESTQVWKDTRDALNKQPITLGETMALFSSLPPEIEKVTVMTYVPGNVNRGQGGLLQFDRFRVEREASSKSQ